MQREPLEQLARLVLPEQPVKQVQREPQEPLDQPVLLEQLDRPVPLELLEPLEQRVQQERQVSQVLQARLVLQEIRVQPVQLELLG